MRTSPTIVSRLRVSIILTLASLGLVMALVVSRPGPAQDIAFKERSAATGMTHRHPAVQVAPGHTKTLLKSDPFEVVGTCLDNGGGDITANAYLKTTQKHASYNVAGSVTSPNFNPSDGEVLITAHPATGTAPDFKAESYFDEFYAQSRAGKVFAGVLGTAVHLHGSGGCAFSATSTGGAGSVPAVPVDAGKSRVLFKSDPFEVVGTCKDHGGGDLTANAYLKTTEKHVAYTAPGEGSSPNFNPSDGKARITEDPATGTVPDFQAQSYYDEVYGQTRTRKVFAGLIGTGTHLHGADCEFSGTFTTSAAQIIKPVNVVPGNTKTLLGSDPFKVVGTCQDNGGGDLTAYAYVKTTQKHASYTAPNVMSVPDFNPADGKGLITDNPAGGTGPDFEAQAYSNELFAQSRTGNILALVAGTAVHLHGSNGCTYSLVGAGSL